MTFNLEEARYHNSHQRRLLKYSQPRSPNRCHACEFSPDEMDAMLDEIERLRADLQACGSYVGIGPNEGDLPVPERVRRCVNRLNGSIGHYNQKLIAQAARIKEHEAREEELLTCYNCGKKVDDINNMPVLGEIHFDPGCPGGSEPPEPSCAYFVCSECLKAEPKARAWQITEGRRAAIKILLIELDDAPTSIHDIDLVIRAENVLRAMLKGAK